VFKTRDSLRKHVKGMHAASAWSNPPPLSLKCALNVPEIHHNKILRLFVRWELAVFWSQIEPPRRANPKYLSYTMESVVNLADCVHRGGCLECRSGTASCPA
jgi:hypothetical protein